jgi:hypothetical protein
MQTMGDISMSFYMIHMYVGGAFMIWDSVDFATGQVTDIRMR